MTRFWPSIPGVFRPVLPGELSDSDWSDTSSVVEEDSDEPTSPTTPLNHHSDKTMEDLSDTLQSSLCIDPTNIPEITPMSSASRTEMSNGSSSPEAVPRQGNEFFSLIGHSCGTSTQEHSPLPASSFSFAYPVPPQLSGRPPNTNVPTDMTKATLSESVATGSDNDADEDKIEVKEQDKAEDGSMDLMSTFDKAASDLGRRLISSSHTFDKRAQTWPEEKQAHTVEAEGRFGSGHGSEFTAESGRARPSVLGGSTTQPPPSTFPGYGMSIIIEELHTAAEASHAQTSQSRGPAVKSTRAQSSLFGGLETQHTHPATSPFVAEAAVKSTRTPSFFRGLTAQPRHFGSGSAGQPTPGTTSLFEQKTARAEGAIKESHGSISKLDSESLHKAGVQGPKGEEAPAKCTLHNPLPASTPNLKPGKDKTELVPEPDGVKTTGETDSQNSKSVKDQLGHFVASAGKNLDLTEPDLKAITPHLTHLYKLAIWLKDRVNENAWLVVGNKRTTDRIMPPAGFSDQIPPSVGANEHKKKQEEEMDKLQQVIEKNTLEMETMLEEFFSRMLQDLSQISKYVASKAPQGDAAKDNTIDRLNAQIRLHDEDYDRLRQNFTAAHNAMEACEVDNDRLHDELDKYQQKTAEKIKELHNNHRSQLNNRLSKSMREHEAAIRKLKEQYATRIDEAEAKLRLYKKATVRIEELEETIQTFEREKADAALAKAATEKELHDLEDVSKVWESYKDAYKQIKTEKDQLTADYNDIVAELADVRNAQEAPIEQNETASAQDTSAQQRGTLQSYGADLDMLEAYWGRQQELAEMGVHKTTAEIKALDAEIEAIARMIQDLEAPDRRPDNNPDDTELYEKPGVVHRNTVGAPQPQLLDTTADVPPLKNRGYQEMFPALASATGSRAMRPNVSRPETWAHRAAMADNSGNHAG